MNRNYMVIHPATTRDESYTIRMLDENKIQGLLSFQDKWVNGQVRYYYDITSKQPLSRVLERRNMRGAELRRLITDLLFTLRQVERFLLDEGHICLKPEYIYVDADALKGFFCFVPGIRWEFVDELCGLSQYLLDHVDYKDGEAVVLAFSLFKECRRMNFGIDDLDRCLHQAEPIMENNKEIPTNLIQVQNELSTELVVEEKIGQEEPHDVKIEEFLKNGIIEPEESKEIVGHSYKKTAIYGVGMMILLLPMIVILLFGINGVYRFKGIILAVEILLSTILFVLLKNGNFIKFHVPEIKRRELDQERTAKKEDSARELGVKKECLEHDWEDGDWEGYFTGVNGIEKEREYERAEAIEYIAAEVQGNRKDGIQNPREVCNALTSNADVRRLVSSNGGDNISIEYYPFIIGRQKDFVDYWLNKPGIDDLHLKIEETEQGYLITDLNSMGGTSVNGMVLGVHEAILISQGDEIMMAAERYYFR